MRLSTNLITAEYGFLTRTLYIFMKVKYYSNQVVNYVRTGPGEF